MCQVVIRVRPPLPRELSGEVEFKNVVHVDNEREQIITVSENLEAVLDESGQLMANPGPYTTHSFVFDHVYDQKATQREVYDTTARAVVDSALQGYNATIFAYGQTGTGLLVALKNSVSVTTLLREDIYNGRLQQGRQCRGPWNNP